MVKLKCFVAMAIGHSDTDDLFEKLIKRQLTKALRIKVNRVDQTDSNDPIDRQIYSLLDACDFCLSDLTYARPSVYYEAGYARGKGKPVIFIARKDHLKRNQSDDLRVHFDLEQESIIPWSNADDRFFTKRLLARTRKVTAPLLRKYEEQQKDNQEVAAFLGLPISKQTDLLRQVGLQALRKAGFRSFRSVPQRKASQNGLLRREQQGIRGVYIWAKTKWSKQDFVTIRMWGLARTIGTYLPDFTGDAHTSFLHLFAVSTLPVPMMRASEAFPYAVQNHNPKWLMVNEPEKARVLYLHILDGIKSASQLRKSILAHIDSISSS